MNFRNVRVGSRIPVGQGRRPCPNLRVDRKESGHSRPILDPSRRHGLSHGGTVEFGLSV
jgi:hypothetical protein